jgi:DNA-directed RNA polymerase subunit RPC12/RpoP
MIINHQITAEDIKNNYVCSACWGLLYSELAKDAEGNITGENIMCVDCGEEVPGFVSNYYVTRRIDESRTQYNLAQGALKDAAPWFFPATRPEAEIMHELGF